jgi:hypothetical protein
MLLICEICGKAITSVMKVPCGYYIDETEDGRYVYTMPTDSESYRNICLECILGETEITT